MKTIGIISDTHCELPDAVLAALRGEYALEQVIRHVAIDAIDNAAGIAGASTDGIPADRAAGIADDSTANCPADSAAEEPPVPAPAEASALIQPSPCDLIAHAGDFGYSSRAEQWIIYDLLEIAPLVAVSGNCDYADMYDLYGRALPQYAVFEECGVSFAMLHDPADLRAAVYGAGVLRPAFIEPVPRVLVHGHTHELRLVTAASGVITICPGSVSRPHGGNPPTIAIMRVEEPGQVMSVDFIAIG